MCLGLLLAESLICDHYKLRPNNEVKERILHRIVSLNALYDGGLLRNSTTKINTNTPTMSNIASK